METIIDKLNKIYEQKTQLKECIVNMGIETSSFNEFADKMNEHQNDVNNDLNQILDIDFEKPISLCATTNIDCWGDSLTDGSGGAISAYPKTLKWFLSQSDSNSSISAVNNLGYGGTSTLFSAVRQGGWVAEVKPTTINGSTPTIIDFMPLHDQTVNLSSYGGGTVISVDTFKYMVNPCTIAGISGTMLINSDKKYAFTRTEAGEDYVMQQPEPFITRGSTYCTTKNHLPIIWIGTNDWRMSDEQLIDAVKDMIGKQQNGKYLVLGLVKAVRAFTRTTQKKIVEANKKFKLRFEYNFIDVLSEFLEHGIEWMNEQGITPVQGDYDDIAQNLVPRSLRSDDTHFNNIGYYYVGKLVYERGKWLGYWF